MSSELFDGSTNYELLATSAVGTGVWMMGGGALALSWSLFPFGTY